MLRIAVSLIIILFVVVFGSVVSGHFWAGENEQMPESITVTVSEDMTVAEFAILAIGVRPEMKLAKDAGLDIGPCEGIKVASNLQTSDPDIYDIGDAIEVKDFVLDVRTASEFNRANVPSSVNIPVDELRNRLDELPKDVTINAYCGVGIRSYIACGILMQNGFAARNISGGFLTYCSYQNKGLSETQSARQLKEEFCLV